MSRRHCAKCRAWCAFDEFGFARRVHTFYRDTGEPAALSSAHCRVDGLTHDVGPQSPDPIHVQNYLALR